jgi:hypothetical protein
MRIVGLRHDKYALLFKNVEISIGCGLGFKK